MEPTKADINLKPHELEALKNAEVIKLTDGQEFVRKDVASKIMAKYAQSELSTAKELIKELLPLAKENAEGRCSISDSYRHRAQIIVEKAKQFI